MTTALTTAFGLAHKHGDAMRASWGNVLDCLLRLNRAGLLPEALGADAESGEAFGLEAIRAKARRAAAAAAAPSALLRRPAAPPPGAPGLRGFHSGAQRLRECTLRYPVFYSVSVLFLRMRDVAAPPARA